jgi:ABC-2 type transport system permease protein
MKQEIKVYLSMLRINLLTGLEYKGWWLMVLQVLLVVVSDPIATIFMFSRFGAIGPWTLERIMLIYAIAVTSFGIAESLCRGFDYFPWKMIRSGDFDRLLLRPRTLFVQVAGSYFHIHRLSRVLAGLAVIIWSLLRQGIVLNSAKVLILLLALAGGALMYCGVFVFSSGIAIFTVKALDWIYIFTNASYQVARCPVDYMPRLLYRVFSFFLPMLLISYYPASAACGWGESAWKGLLALPAGCLFLLFSLLVWRIGVRHYKSTGS